MNLLRRSVVCVRSQAWLKEINEENLSDDDKKRVALRHKRNAEIFNAETMEEDIKRLRVHLAFYLQSMRPRARPRAVCSPAAALGSRGSVMLALRGPWRAGVLPLLLCSCLRTVGRTTPFFGFSLASPPGAVRPRHSSMVDKGMWADLGRAKAVNVRQRVISTAIVYLAR